jgi:hypothetical protein
MNVWCARRGIATEHSPEFEGKVRIHTPGKNVVKIVTFDDAEFLALKEHDQWHERLS